MQATPAIAEKSWRDKILGAMFLLLIFAPILDAVFHLDTAPSAKENRRLSAVPRFSRESGLRQYFKDVEAYCNDHFGFRNSLVRLNNKARYSLFADQQSGDVIIGKNDWLFFAGDGMVEHYGGIHRFTGKQLASWQKLLERRRDWLAKRGTKYIFVVAPDKQSIYPENLPDWIKKGSEGTMLDQFVAYMRTHSTVEVVDVRTILTEARAIAPTYFNTDTHWNQFGGFLATREVIRKSSLSAPPDLDWFDRENKTMPGGDLVNMLGLDVSDISEVNFFQFAPRTNLPSLHWMADPGHDTNQPGCAVVFHDSFGENMEPFLKYHFSDVFYRRHYYFNRELIEKQPTALVLSEMVERYLITADVEKLLEQDSWMAGDPAR